MASSRILIVEDEADHGAALKSVLERNGHIVLGLAPSCSAALEILWRERPDLAFVDTHLGAETCQAVLEECDRLDVPVIITAAPVTGLPAFIGERGHIMKPVETATVRSALEKLSA
jgi:DNA-binding response OmpR family regulator